MTDYRQVAADNARAEFAPIRSYVVRVDLPAYEVEVEATTEADAMDQAQQAWDQDAYFYTARGTWTVRDGGPV